LIVLFAKNQILLESVITKINMIFQQAANVNVR